MSKLSAEEYLKKSKACNISYYSFFKDSNFVLDNPKIKPDEVVLIKDALEAVRLAREDAVKDHLRIGSKELDLLIKAHDNTKEVEARVAEKIGKWLVDNDYFCSPPCTECKLEQKEFKKRFLESEKEDVGFKDNFFDLLPISSSKDSKKCKCRVCEPDSGRDVDVIRRLKKEDK